MDKRGTLKTFLWFNEDLAAALRHYKSIFGDHMVIAGEHLMSDQMFIAEFSIFDHNLIGMNTPGGDTFNNAISFSVQVDGQAEVDRIWDALTATGEPGRCGWCKDKWGVAWQVVPYQMQDFLGHADSAKAQQNMGIMMEMGKIELSKFVQ